MTDDEINEFLSMLTLKELKTLIVMLKEGDKNVGAKEQAKDKGQQSILLSSDS